MSPALKQAVVAASIAVLAGAGGFLVARHLNPPPVYPDGMPHVPDAKGALEGQPAPAVTVNDLDGKPRSLTDWRGKWLLVNFWATWCGPCIEEIPLLIAAQRDYGASGLQVLGIALDDPDTVRAAMKERGFNYPSLAGDDTVMTALEQLGNTLGAIPYTVLISPDGVIRDMEMGGIDAHKVKMLAERFIPPAH